MLFRWAPLELIAEANGLPEAHGPPKVHGPRGHCTPLPPLSVALHALMVGSLREVIGNLLILKHFSRRDQI